MIQVQIYMTSHQQELAVKDKVAENKTYKRKNWAATLWTEYNLHKKNKRQRIRYFFRSTKPIKSHPQIDFYIASWYFILK
jgi:hypothetical protein